MIEMLRNATPTTWPTLYMCDTDTPDEQWTLQYNTKVGRCSLSNQALEGRHCQDEIELALTSNYYPEASICLDRDQAARVVEILQEFIRDAGGV